MAEMPNGWNPEVTYACAKRLKTLINLAEGGNLTTTDLVQNLQYAVVVLESIVDDETKHLANDQEELAAVAKATLPEEVRDWLTTTFSRRASERTRPTFRAVANAIRAGVRIDRIFRRLSTPAIIELSPSLRSMIKVDTWEFDVIEMNKLSDNHSMKIIAFEVLNHYDIINKFRINTSVLENLLTTLEMGYSKHENPYHNLTHAADVTQTCHCIISMTEFTSVMNELEIFALLFSALIHDYEHTGTTNNFHIKTASDLALIYNDKGVLENFHISSVYQLMRDGNLNILSNLSREEYSEFRRMVVEMVLNTDMSLHFQQIKSVKNLLTVPENVDKSQALSLILHCADISHPTKPWVMHERWTDRLVQEFFRQGHMERERGLPYSPQCDPNNTLIAHSQLGFINFIVVPSFEVMTDLLVKIMGPLFNSEDQVQYEEPTADHTRSPPPFPAPWFKYAKFNIDEWEKRKQIELQQQA